MKTLFAIAIGLILAIYWLYLALPASGQSFRITDGRGRQIIGHYAVGPSAGATPLPGKDCGPIFHDWTPGSHK